MTIEIAEPLPRDPWPRGAWASEAVGALIVSALSVAAGAAVGVVWRHLAPAVQGVITVSGGQKAAYYENPETKGFVGQDGTFAVCAVVAGVALVALGAVQRRPTPAVARAWGWIIVLGLVNVTVAFAAMFAGVAGLATGTAAVLANAQPLLIVLPAWWLYGEKPSARTAVALVIGFTGGTIPEVKVNRLLLSNIDVRGVGWGAYAMVRPGYMRSQWERLVPLMRSGAIDPPIGATYPLDKVADALVAMDERRTLGKSVVVL